NSPWLHELTLRSDELTRRLAERFGAVRSLRFASGKVEAEPTSGRAGVRLPAPLDAQAQREIDAAAAVIPDPEAAAAARRLMTKAWRRLPAILVAAVLAGCASGGAARGPMDDEMPRLAALGPDPRADAYYAYTQAQMHVQAGRFKDAIPFMQKALERDPNSAALWTQFAQILMRVDSVDEAVTAARRAVELAPDQSVAHLTLAELFRVKGKISEAESELEKAIALNPTAEEPYLTLARIHAARPARVDEAWIRVLRAEDVGSRQRRVPPRRDAGAVKPARPLLPGDQLHGRRPRRGGEVGARADPARGPPVHRRARPARVPLRTRQALRRGDRHPARRRQHGAQAARAVPLPRDRVLPRQAVRSVSRDAPGGPDPRRQAEGPPLPAGRGLREAIPLR